MKHKRTTQQEVDASTWTCDAVICPVRVRSRREMKVCHMCGHDFCHDHSRPDARDNSHHPDWYCYRCWDIGEPYRARLEAAEDEFEAVCQRIDDEWKAACKETESK